MAEAEDNPTTPEQQPGEANPHSIGRHTPVRYNVRRDLMQTGYGAREAMLDIIRVARDGADAKDVPKRKRPLLRAGADMVEAGLRVFVDRIDESDRAALLTVMWGMRGIGANSGRLTEKQLDQMEAARGSKTDLHKEVREYALALLSEARKNHPKRVSRYIAEKTNAAMNEKHPGANSKITSRTVAGWVKEAAAFSAQE
jgi:hypothetical protein